jgi:hypothetical protein
VVDQAAAVTILQSALDTARARSESGSEDGAETGSENGAGTGSENGKVPE